MTATTTPGPSSTSSDKSTALPGNALPAVYILTGYFTGQSQTRSTSKLEPLADTIVFAQDPCSVKYDPKNPMMLRTGTFGQLNTFHDETLTSRQLLHAHVDQQRPILLPPEDVVSFFKAAKGENWKSDIISELAKLAPDSAMQELELEEHPVSNLRKPKPTGDEEYKQWYDSLAPSKPILAYVIAKTRAAIFVANKILPINFDETIKVTHDRIKEPEEVFWISDDIDLGEHRVAVLSGTRVTRPDGLYRVQIPLNTADIKENPKKWNTLTKTPDADGNYSYSLAAMVRFDITNPAGEFDIINCDPITLEEAMMTQFPRYYSHLLDAAKDLPKEHSDQTPDLDDKDAGNSDISDKPNPSQGLVDYWTNVNVMKQTAKLGADLVAADITKKDKGALSITTLIAGAIHQHLETDNNEKVKKTLDAVFALKDGRDAWTDFRDARAAYIKAKQGGEALDSWSTSLAKEYVLPNNTPDSVKKYQSSLAKRIGVPKMGLDYANKAIKVVDLGLSTKALVEDGYTYFTESIPDLKKALDSYKALTKDYFDTLGEHEIKHAVTITSQFELDKAAVQPRDREAIQAQVNSIIEGLKADPNLKVTVSGHTCDLGTYEYNLKLSKNRANAVKQLLMDAGIEESRIVANGFSYDNSVVDNTSEDNRARNRRVELVSEAIGRSSICPSREGMGTLERYRNLTVQRQLKLKDAELQMALQATEMALGILSVIPATAPAACAVLLAKGGYDVMTSLCSAMDEAFNNGVLQQYLDDKEKIRTFNKETKTNRRMMAELYHQHAAVVEKAQAKNEDYDDDLLWAAQFRVRAEAIAGLIDLLLKAALNTGNRSYEQRIAQMRIDAYIENFILGDDWLYPIDFRGGNLNMSTYWIHALEHYNHNHAQPGYAKEQTNFGFDEQFRLVSRQALNEIAGDAKQRLKYNTKKNVAPNARGRYMMTRAALRSVGWHITSDYQKYFPVHVFNALDSAEAMKDFAETFKPLFRDVDDAAYRFIRIYYKPDYSDDWHPFPANKYNQSRSGDYVPWRALKITPFTPIRVIVALEDGIAPVVPLTFAIERLDGVDVEGLSYQELAKPLLEDDLLHEEKSLAGRVGCVFYPFYQFWDQTYLGIKPVVGSTRIEMFGAERYHALGFMDDMRYQITCQIGDNTTTERPLDMLYDPDGVTRYSDTPIPINEIHMDLQLKREGTDTSEGALLLDSFLVSKTTSFEYPELYEGKRHNTNLMIKVGKDSPYIASGRRKPAQYTPRIPGPIFADEIAKTQSKTHIQIEADETELTFHNFNWEDRVDFLFTFSCWSANKENYRKRSVDWRSIPIEMTLFADDSVFSSAEGPTLSSDLVFLGHLGASRGRVLKYDDTDVRQDLNPEFDDIIEMLKRVGTTVFSEKDNEKLLALFGGNYEDEWNGVYPIFASHFACQYISPKLKTINSLRPFGDIYDEAGSGQLTFVARNFRTAGKSGVDIAELSDLFELKYSFEAPKSFRKEAPWTQTLDDKELQAYETLLDENELKRLKDPELTKEEAKKWLEDDAKVVNPKSESLWK